MTRQLLKESVLYGISGTLNRFIGIFLIPLYTRLFSPSDYGMLDLLTTTSALLALLAGLYIESGLARDFYETRAMNREKELVGTALIISTASGVSWITVSVFIFVFSIKGYMQLTWMHIAPMLLSIVPSQYMDIFLILLRYQRRLGAYLLFSLGDVLLSTFLTICAVVYFHWGIPGVLWGLCVARILGAITMSLALRRDFEVAWNGKLARQMLLYSLPLVPAGLAKWGQNYANRFILAITFSLADLGIYSLAVKIASVVILIDTSFRMAWDPHAIELIGKNDFEKKYVRTFGTYLLGMFAISALIASWGTPLVMIIAGPAYHDAGRLVGLITIGLLWSGMDKFFALGNIVVRKTYWNLIGYTIGIIINILVLWIVGNKLGLFSVGIAYIVGGIASSLALLWSAQRNYPIPYRKSVVALSLILSVSYGVWSYFAEPIMLKNTPLALWVIINMAIALFLLLLLSLYIFPKDVFKQKYISMLEYIKLLGRRGNGGT